MYYKEFKTITINNTRCSGHTKAVLKCLNTFENSILIVHKYSIKRELSITYNLNDRIFDSSEINEELIERLNIDYVFVDNYSFSPLKTTP